VSISGHVLSGRYTAPLALWRHPTNLIRRNFFLLGSTDHLPASDMKHILALPKQRLPRRPTQHLSHSTISPNFTLAINPLGYSNKELIRGTLFLPHSTGEVLLPCKSQRYTASMSPSSGTPDWDIPLSKLAQGKDGHELLREASSFIYREDGSPGLYLSKLRFLAPLQTRSHPAAHIDNILDPFSDCIYSGYIPFTATDYLSEIPSLVLTDPGALAGYKHYVAISYY
jgi:hypothetical protein